MRAALWAFILLGLVAGKCQAQGQLIPCVDTLGLRQQFLDGEVDEAFTVWQSYFRAAQQAGAHISRPCFASGAKMMGVLNLRLPTRLDTNQAMINFYMVLKLSPRAEMWDLWLPLETQGYWDAVREEFGPTRTAEQIWQDRWLPPVSHLPAKDPEATTLRKAYHRNRLLYANAREDEENYYKIMENIRSLRDPTFTLLRTDVMLRLGMNVTQTKQELLKYVGQRSKVMSEGDLVGWSGRLAVLVKEQKESLEPKDTSEISPQPPKLRPKLKLTRARAQ